MITEVVFRSSVPTTTSPPPASSLNKLSKEILLNSQVLSKRTADSAS